MNRNENATLERKGDLQWSDISNVDLLKQTPFAKPDRKKRQRPKTWKDEWEKIIIEQSPYAKHMAPVKEKHVLTPAEIAERKINKLKKRLDIQDRDLLSENQMEEDVDLSAWRKEVDAMTLLLGPDDDHAVPFPMTALHTELTGQPAVHVSNAMKQEFAMYQIPKYVHVEFEDSAEGWRELQKGAAVVVNKDTRSQFAGTSKAPSLDGFKSVSSSYGNTPSNLTAERRTVNSLMKEGDSPFSPQRSESPNKQGLLSNSLGTVHEKHPSHADLTPTKASRPLPLTPKDSTSAATQSKTPTLQSTTNSKGKNTQPKGSQSELEIVDPNEKSRRRLAAFLEKKSLNQMEPTDLPLSSEMKGNMQYFLEENLGTGVWSDKVGSVLVRPMDAIMVHCPPDALATFPEAAPAFDPNSSTARPSTWDLSSTQKLGASSSRGVSTTAQLNFVEIEGPDPETTRLLNDPVARGSLFLERQAVVAEEDGNEEEAIELWGQASQLIEEAGLFPSPRKGLSGTGTFASLRGVGFGTGKWGGGLFPYDEHIHGLARRIQRKARKYLLKKNMCATHIQRTYRGHLVRRGKRRLQRKRNQAAKYIQRCARRRFKQKIIAATNIQAHWRGSQGRAFARLLRRRIKAAVEIQKVARGMLGRRRVALIYFKREAILMIQRNFRGYLCRADRYRVLEKLHKNQIAKANLILQMARRALGRMYYNRLMRQCIQDERQRLAEERALMVSAAELAGNKVRLYLGSEEGKLELKLEIEKLKAKVLQDKKKVSKMSAQEREKFEAWLVFNMFDTDGSETIDAKELKALTRSLGVPMTSADLRFALKQMDQDGSGEIEFEEFYAWLTQPDTKANNAQLAPLRQYLKARQGWAALTGKDLEERAISGMVQREAKRAARAAQSAFRREPGKAPRFTCADCHQAFCLYSEYKAHFTNKIACHKSHRRGNLFPAIVIGSDLHRSQVLAQVAFERLHDEMDNMEAEGRKAEIRARVRFNTEPWKSRLKKVSENIAKEIFASEKNGSQIGFSTVQNDLIARAFQAFDFDGSGSIDNAEFLHLVQALQLKLSSLEIEHALREMDEDGSGEISLEEFAKWYRQTVEYSDIAFPEDDSADEGDDTPLARPKSPGPAKGFKMYMGGGILKGIQAKQKRNLRRQLIKFVAMQEAQCLFIRLSNLQGQKKEMNRFRTKQPPDFSWIPSVSFLQQHRLLQLSEEHDQKRINELDDAIEELLQRLNQYQGFAVENDAVLAGVVEKEDLVFKIHKALKVFEGCCACCFNSKIYMIDEDSQNRQTEAEEQHLILVRRLQIEMDHFLRMPEGKRCLEMRAHRLKCTNTIEKVAMGEQGKLPEYYLKYVFNLFDEGKSGMIDRTELSLLVKELGIRLQKWEVRRLIESLDRHSDRKIHFQDIKQWYLKEGLPVHYSSLKSHLLRTRRARPGFMLYLHHARVSLMAEARALATDNKVTVAELDADDDIAFIQLMKKEAQRNLFIKQAEVKATTSLKDSLKTPKGHHQFLWTKDRIVAHKELTRLLKAACLTPLQEQTVKWRGVFQLFDTDASGKIDEEELSRLMEMLAMPCNESEVIFLLKEIDQDASGQLDFDEFNEFISKPGAVSNFLRKRFLARVSSFQKLMWQLLRIEVRMMAEQMLASEARAQARQNIKKAMADEERRNSSATTARQSSIQNEVSVASALNSMLSQLTAIETKATADGKRYSRTNEGRLDLAIRCASLKKQWNILRDSSQSQASDKVSSDQAVYGPLLAQWILGAHISPWNPCKIDFEEVKYFTWSFATHFGAKTKSMHSNMMQKLQLSPLGTLQPDPAFFEEEQVLKICDDEIRSLVIKGNKQQHSRFQRAPFSLFKPAPPFKEMPLENLISELRTAGRVFISPDASTAFLNDDDSSEDIGQLCSSSSVSAAFNQTINAASVTSAGTFKNSYKQMSRKLGIAEAEAIAFEEAKDFLKTRAGRHKFKSLEVKVDEELRAIETDGWLQSCITSPVWALLEEGDDIEKDAFCCAFAAFSTVLDNRPRAGVRWDTLLLMFKLLGIKPEAVGRFIFNLSDYFSTKNGHVDQLTVKLFETATSLPPSNQNFCFEEAVQFYERLRTTLYKSEFFEMMSVQKITSRRIFQIKITNKSFFGLAMKKAVEKYLSQL